MKNIFITLLFLFMVGQRTWADSEIKEYDRMIIYFMDGTNKEIPINARSKIQCHMSFENGEKMKVIDIKGDGCNYRYRRNEILTIKFIETELTGLTPIFDWEGEKDHFLQFENNCVRVHKKLEGEQFRIYDISGRLLQSRKVPTGGVIDLSKLPQGVYSVCVNKYSLQIVKS